MPQNKSKQHKKKNKKRQGVRGTSVQAIPRKVGLILPDQYRTNLRYWKQVSFSFLSSNTTAIRFRPSAAFDVDPLIASTAMAGFAELSLLYSSYRVLSSKINVNVMTTSAANPVNVSLTPVNFDPGATPSSAYVLAAREQPYTRFGTCGFNGSPPLKLNSNMSTVKIYGSKQALFDDNFSAPVTAIPNNNWYWVICGYSFVLDPSLTWVTITIEVDCQFYDRNFLPN